ncbi:DndE family protein [Clostridium beijerinckii]|uniref:DndE family protein n=1 Tax=Clostridium beijerinckii TaxID=1520 RepID=UPI001494958E|nr:DndE family protein [Clostridium beijerinckii]NOW04435.1 DNA sulfur modification protein DndE [Clostridium beijerinckii]NYC02423.1 DNA sulfur modification protein DndE [Clostridium beijerinckii]
MGFRLKTSKKTKEIFEEIGNSSNLKPFALSKIAVSLSLKYETSIDEYINDDANGLELQRSTVTGDFDAIFKALFEVNLKRNISDDEYYPHYMKLHMDRGAELLLKQYKYSGGNLEKFLGNALQKGDANL